MTADNKLFQSTLPAREATSVARDCKGSVHFNPRFPRGKRPPHQHQYRCDTPISIHASREGSDGKGFEFIHGLAIFQSTLPAREATRTVTPSETRIVHFNPRFPRGKRLGKALLHAAENIISIHASREGSDRNLLSLTFAYAHFNPRFPRGKRLS